jgi:hypothetical protein
MGTRAALTKEVIRGAHTERVTVQSADAELKKRGRFGGWHVEGSFGLAQRRLGGRS